MAEKQFKGIHGMFPCPVYVARRDTNLSPEEEKEIEDIIEEGVSKNAGNSQSNNSAIFNGKLKEIKQFCEQQLNIYVENIICPEEKIDFYITQSWLNVTKPGEFHHEHSHQNSIISGVFYISTVLDDKITFKDPNMKLKELINFAKKDYTLYNTIIWYIPSITNELILFPSWLNHRVDPNERATTDRISISFNTFVRGTLGGREQLNELIL